MKKQSKAQSNNKAQSSKPKAAEEGTTPLLDEVESKRSGEISEINHLFRKLQEALKRRMEKKSPHTRQEIPEEPGDLVMDSIMRSEQKRAAGAERTREDNKHAQSSVVKEKVAPLTVAVLIDGSGSMDQKDGTNSLSRLAIGGEVATMLYLGARGEENERGENGLEALNTEVYMGIFGGNNPQILATPQSTRDEVEEAIERTRKGMNSSTDLAPMIKKITETLANDEGNPADLLGHTHFIIVSDGDLTDNGGDKAPARAAMRELLEHYPNIMIDVLIINKDAQDRGTVTSMERLVKELEAEGLVQGNVGVTKVWQQDDAVQAAVELVEERANEVVSQQTMETRWQRRMAMDQARDAMSR